MTYALSYVIPTWDRESMSDYKYSEAEDYEDLADPVESGEEVVSNLEEAIDLIKSVIKELKALENK